MAVFITIIPNANNDKPMILDSRNIRPLNSTTRTCPLEKTLDGKTKGNHGQRGSYSGHQGVLRRPDVRS